MTIPALARRAHVAALLFLALGLSISTALAQQIPALLDIPAAIAPAHPDLVERRANLVQVRDALRSRTASHNAECSSVEVGSAQDSSCTAARAALAADINRHIEASNVFNADVRRIESVCVRDYGYDLVFALRDCEHNQPSTFSYACLNGTGISEKSLACLGAKPTTGSAGALAACGILGMVPVDAASRCQDIKDVCVTRALQAHKDRTATCLH